MDCALDRVFLSHPFTARHQVAGQRVHGIDGMFMKHGKLDSIILVLVGRDGNNENITLATALCGSDSADNCAWFVDQCLASGINLSCSPMLCDRGNGNCVRLTCPSTVNY